MSIKSDIFRSHLSPDFDLNERYFEPEFFQWYFWLLWINRDMNLQRKLNSDVFDVEVSMRCRLTLRRPLRRKLRMRWFFDISKMKEWSFLNRTSLTRHQIFDAHLLETTDFSPFRFYFSVGFISRSCFESDGFIAYSNEWERREKERC